MRRAGAAPAPALVWALQESDARHAADRSKLFDCRVADPTAEAGTYEVCLVNDTWLVGERGQANLRRERAITTADAQMEPWFFAATV